MGMFYCAGCRDTVDADEVGFRHDDEQDEDYCTDCYEEIVSRDEYTLADHKQDRADEENDERWMEAHSDD